MDKLLRLRKLIYQYNHHILIKQTIIQCMKSIVDIFPQKKNNSNALRCLDEKKINIGIGKQSVFEQVICN